MAYYFVANYDVNDEAMYGEYMKHVGRTLGKTRARVLVADHEPKNLENESRHTLIILEFDSEEAFRGWYDSPEYRDIIDLRLNASEGWAREVAEFVLPPRS